MANKGPGNKGAGSHREGCSCPFCLAARKRKEKTFISTVGDGRDVEILKEDIIHADVPSAEAGRVTARERIVQWLSIRAAEPSLTNTEIARRMNLSISTLYSHIRRATKHGWLKFDDPLARLEHEIIPKVMDNLSEFMNEKDKTATLEIAKGTVFKHYQSSMGISDQPVTVLALKIEPVDPTNVKIMSGQIIGKPRALTE